jgi:hypothetical protein
MSKKKASDSDQSDDDADDSVTEDRANTTFIPTLDIFIKANAISIQPINPKGGHSYLFDGGGKSSLIFYWFTLEISFQFTIASAYPV